MTDPRQCPVFAWIVPASLRAVLELFLMRNLLLLLVAGLLMTTHARPDSPSGSSSPGQEKERKRNLCSAMAKTVSGKLEVKGCGPCDPMDFDLPKLRSVPFACVMHSGVRIEANYPNHDHFDSLLRGTKEGKSVFEVIIEPQTKARAVGMGVTAQIACDPEIDRAYHLQPWQGVITALNGSGKILWSYHLPGFKSIDEDADIVAAANVENVWKAIQTWASVGSRLVQSGEYLLAEVGTGGVGRRQFVLHRSGRLIGQIGPSDAIATYGIVGGFEIFMGGGTDLRFYVPTDRFELEVRGDRTASLISHGIAWLRPRPTDRTPHFNCLARTSDELKHWLGKRFVAEDASASKAFIGELGAEEWYEGLLSRSELAQVLARFQPPSSEWQEEFRQALFEAGVDVEIAKKME